MSLVKYGGTVPGLTRVNLPNLLAVEEVVRPTEQGIFYDPADTYTFAYATLDVVDATSRVFELGAGMGLATWMVSSVTERVHGVDIVEASVRFADGNYSSDNTSFSIHDYFFNGPRELLKHWPVANQIPNVLAANPPYVPCESRESCKQLPT